MKVIVFILCAHELKKEKNKKKITFQDFKGFCRTRMFFNDKTVGVQKQKKTIIKSSGEKEAGCH